MFSNYTESGPALLGASAGASAGAKLRASFRFVNTDVTTANVLRRAILTRAPSVAFRTEPAEKSDVVIRINTTPLVNEMLAHRIGMIPICADPDTFRSEDYEFTLDKENTTKEILNVYASDFVVLKKNPENPLDAPVQVPTEQFFPPDPITGETVLITRLRPQWNPAAPTERLQVKARASVSTGEENIRWSPVSQCAYEYTLDTDEEHKKAVFDAWLATNKKIPDVSALPPERLDELQREFNTMEVQRCYLKNERGEPYDFTFYIESVGAQDIPTIVRRGIAACEALVTKYQDLDVTLPESVRLQQGDSRFPTIDVYFGHEGHTLGNLLSVYLVDNHIDGVAEPKLTYAGYKVPHPLRPEMFVRVSADGEDVETQKQSARFVIATACRELKRRFATLGAAWDAARSGGAAGAAGAETTE
jgi:DNA-directed RNA polymerase subunit L